MTRSEHNEPSLLPAGGALARPSGPPPRGGQPRAALTVTLLPELKDQRPRILKGLAVIQLDPDPALARFERLLARRGREHLTACKLRLPQEDVERLEQLSEQLTRSHDRLVALYKVVNMALLVAAEQEAAQVEQQSA